MNTDVEYNNILQFVLKQHNISVDDVLQDIEMNKNLEILNKHKENHKIWKSNGNNPRWYTYLPDETKPKGVRLIAKSSEDSLNKAILDYYKALEKHDSKMNIENLYPEWLQYKTSHTASSRTIKIIDGDYKKFYMNTEIITIPINNLTTYDLDIWAHKMIAEYRLTKKRYFNMAIVMRQLLDYAVYINLIPENPFAKVKINTKLFVPVKKKQDKTQVFLIEEQKSIEQLAYQDYIDSDFLACLAIPLCFQLGTRIGELVCIKWDDLEEKQNHIHIQRMESKLETKDSTGKWIAKRIVVEHTKSSAGDRYIFLTKKALELFHTIKEYHICNGIKSDYIFVNKSGNRIHEPALDTRIRKYCRHSGINEKSMHKIRKTYCSALIDANLNINFIRMQMGHESELTTYQSYCFNRMSENDTHLEVEKALNA